jgi:hypothetical protein
MRQHKFFFAFCTGAFPSLGEISIAAFCAQELITENYSPRKLSLKFGSFFACSLFFVDVFEMIRAASLQQEKEMGWEGTRGSGRKIIKFNVSRFGGWNSAGA